MDSWDCRHCDKDLGVTNVISITLNRPSPTDASQVVYTEPGRAEYHTDCWFEVAQNNMYIPGRVKEKYRYHCTLCDETVDVQTENNVNLLHLYLHINNFAFNGNHTSVFHEDCFRSVAGEAVDF